MGEEQTTPESDEYDRVLANNTRMLRVECGFNEHQAAALAEAGITWHDAKPLILRGCDLDTAVDILL